VIRLIALFTASAAVLGASCVSRTLPPPPAPPPVLDLRPIVIRDTLADDEQVCVLRDPFNDPRLICLTVGELRRLIRGHVLARAEAQR
jgi:hypothetical protein